MVVIDEKAYDDMCTQLHRIGYLYGGIASWQEMGFPIARLWQISAADLKEKLELKDYKHLLDVRTPAEWATGVIKGVPDIPKDEEIIETCGMGYRGNIAASFLQGEGFEHVHSLAGGMKVWVNAGFPVA